MKKKRKRISKATRIRWHVEQMCCHRRLAVNFGVAAVDKYKEALGKESLWAALVSLSVAYADAGRCLFNVKQVRSCAKEACFIAGVQTDGRSHINRTYNGLVDPYNWLGMLCVAMDTKDVSQVEYMRGIVDLRESLGCAVGMARNTKYAERGVCKTYGIDLD